MVRILVQQLIFGIEKLLDICRQKPGLNASRLKWLLLAVLSLTWGSSFILIKQSLLVYSPYQVGALRMCIAGMALLYFGIKNFKYIPKKLLPWVVLGSCLGNFIPMFLFPLAQQEVNSSLAGILDSLVPIFILLFGFVFFKIRSRKSQLLGAVIGFVGATILMADDGGGGKANLFYSSLIVIATAFYGMNSLIVGNFLSQIPSFKLSSVVFTIWLGPSLLVLGLTGFFPGFSGTQQQWVGLGYVCLLGLIGTALAMVLYYRLIQATSPIFASTVTYLMPLVAMGWGFMDGEQFYLIHALGGLLILIGIYLIQKKPREVSVPKAMEKD